MANTKYPATITDVSPAVDGDGKRRTNSRGNQWTVVTIQPDEGDPIEFPIWEKYEDAVDRFPEGERGVFTLGEFTRVNFVDALLMRDLEGLGL